MKTITLPFTCNQLKWSALIISPLMIICGLLLRPYDMNIAVVFSLIAVVCTICSWGTQILLWDIEGKIPHFKCRCDK